MNLRWKKNSLRLNAEQLKFKGNENLGTELLELETPIQSFLGLFPRELIIMISESHQPTFIKFKMILTALLRVIYMDIKQFMGMVYLMYFIQLPN